MLAMMSLVCLGLLGMAFLPDPTPAVENESDSPVAPKDSENDDLGNEIEETFFFGTEADDVLEGGDGAHYIDGFDGDDLISGSVESDILHGGPGNDYIAGRSGDDLLFGHTGGDKIFGQNGDDELVGGDSDDSIFGGQGTDALSGNLGQDYLVGGVGEDVLFGGAGRDFLDGKTDEATPESDFLNGGAGDDVLYGGMKDIMTGGTGADTYLIDISLNEGADPAEIHDFEKGIDQIEIALLPDDPHPNIEIVARGSESAVHLDGLVALVVTNTPFLDQSDISFVRLA